MVHAVALGDMVTACCGHLADRLPRGHRISSDYRQVTCTVICPLTSTASLPNRPTEEP
jgi:hypothetical protein